MCQNDYFVQKFQLFIQNYQSHNMVIKVIEIMASSSKSWEDAAQNALNEASKSLRGIKSIYIHETSATVEDGKIAQYRVNCKISFEVQ